MAARNTYLLREEKKSSTYCDVIVYKNELLLLAQDGSNKTQIPCLLCKQTSSVKTNKNINPTSTHQPEDFPTGWAERGRSNLNLPHRLLVLQVLRIIPYSYWHQCSMKSSGRVQVAPFKLLHTRLHCYLTTLLF